MAVKMGNKVKIGITISPYLNEQAEQLLNTGKFSSMALTTQAAVEVEDDEQQMLKVLSEYVKKHPEKFEEFM
jgi:hypothetical protein